MNLKTKKLKSILLYFYPPLIVMIILLVVFKIKSVYPFGPYTIDYMDMGQMNTAMYCHLYDAMHGSKSLFYDWYSTLGINMTASVSLASLISPFNLFFYFVSREYILQSLSIFTMIKIMAMSFTMFIYIKKRFSITPFWMVIFSLCYSFSGFVLQYYTNSQWLDIVAMFPLLLLGMHYLFERNHMVLYTVMLTLCLVANLYCSAMILMFLFFIGGLYIILIAPKNSRKNKVWLWGISTLSAVGLSAFINLPAYIQISESSRAMINGSLVKFILGIYDTVNYSDPQKWWMLFGTSLLIVIIIKGVIATRKGRNITLFVVGSILIVTLQIYFENINLIWSGGSYVCFPIRFGYMISFVLVSAACYYISRNPIFNTPITFGSLAEDINRVILKILIGIIGAFVFLLIALKTYNYILSHDSSEVLSMTLFGVYVILFIAMIIVFTVILSKRNRLINYRWVSIIVIPELIAGAFIFIPPAKSTQNAIYGQSSDYIATSYMIKQDFSIPSSRTDRIKNEGNTLNANYPFVMEHASLSNWTHTITLDDQTNLKNLGYSINYTRLLDSGGTAFSDALLNFRQTLSTYKMNNALYCLSAKKDSYWLYHNNYTLPFGITVSDRLTSIQSNFQNPFDYQNALFKAFTGDNELINKIDVNGKVDSNAISDVKNQTVGKNHELEYELHIRGRKALYFCWSGNSSQMSLFVQGKVVPIPSVDQISNLKYPADFNNNIILLGTYSDETVNFKIVSPDFISKNNVQIGLLDMDKLETFTAQYESYDAGAKTSGSGVSLTVNGSTEKNLLFLPITYDKGWSCKVNGKEVPVIKVANSFIGVHLQNGVSHVQLTFFPRGMKVGILISLITAILLAAYGLLHRKIKVSIPNLLLKSLEHIFYIVWGTALTFVYIVSIIYTIFFKLLFRR